LHSDNHTTTNRQQIDGGQSTVHTSSREQHHNKSTKGGPRGPHSNSKSTTNLQQVDHRKKTIDLIPHQTNWKHIDSKSRTIRALYKTTTKRQQHINNISTTHQQEQQTDNISPKHKALTQRQQNNNKATAQRHLNETQRQTERQQFEDCNTENKSGTEQHDIKTTTNSTTNNDIMKSRGP
jgi:hypothetical protein